MTLADNDNELLPIVDADGNIIDQAARSICHDGSHLLHPVIHLHLFNSNGKLFLQLRPEWKTIQPGKWDTAVGGHVAYGEDTLSALRRETMEEIGLEPKNIVPAEKYIFNSEVESELVYPFIMVSDSIPKPSDELAGGRFFTPEEIEQAISSGILTPNFVQEYKRLIPIFAKIFQE